MIDLVEQFKEQNDVYVWLESTKGFLYAEYVVSKSEYKGIRKHVVHLSLKKAERKKRYFNEVIIVNGFRLEDNKTLRRPYRFYDDMEELTKDFCKYIENHSEENQKLLKKTKNRYPEFF